MSLEMHSFCLLFRNKDDELVPHFSFKYPGLGENSFYCGTVGTLKKRFDSAWRSSGSASRGRCFLN